MPGKLEILHVQGGEVTITFDTQDCAEAIRAKRIISDMIRRGYALLVKMPNGTYTRAYGFDESIGEYIVADFDATQAEGADAEEEAAKPLRGRRRVAIDKAEAVAVAPRVGG